MKIKTLGLLIVMFLVLSFTPIAKASTLDSVMAQVKLLQTQVSALQSRMYGLTLRSISPTSETTDYSKIVDQNITASKSITAIPAKTTISETLIPRSNPCLSSTSPWIKITNPVAGTQLIKGNSYDFTWTSCNVPANANIGINLDSGEYYGVWGFGLAAKSYPVLNTGSTQMYIPNYTTAGFLKLRIFAIWPGGHSEGVSSGLYNVIYPQSVCNAASTPFISILTPDPSNNNMVLNLQGGTPNMIWDDCNMPSRYRADVSLENIQTGIITNLISNTTEKQISTIPQQTFSQLGLSAGTYRYKISVLRVLDGSILPPLIVYSSPITLQ